MKEELKKTENGENNGSGSAEKTEKKKILSPMGCIVIALLLSAVCVVAIGMFGSSIARVLCYFQQNLGETKVGPTNLDETEVVDNRVRVGRPAAYTCSCGYYDNPNAGETCNHFCERCNFSRMVRYCGEIHVCPVCSGCGEIMKAPARGIWRFGGGIIVDVREYDKFIKDKGNVISRNNYEMYNVTGHSGCVMDRPVSNHNW